MSGIYLICWDEKHKEKSPILHSTNGGYPHITLAYTGSHVPLAELVSTASALFPNWAMKIVTCTNAFVNSFECNGRMRHDVLMRIAQSNDVETCRNEFILKMTNASQFSIRIPHITHGIYESLEEAQSVVRILNSDWLPYDVEVTGFTIE